MNYKLSYLYRGVWVVVAQAPAEKVFAMSKSAMKAGFITKISAFQAIA